MSENNRGTYPFVSVVMPVRNEEAFIQQSVGAVLAQDFPHERMELLVADGMSNDATRALIQQLDSVGINVRILDNPGKFASTGLNAAIAAARGEIIVRVDGHTRIAPDYVRYCVLALLETDAANVGGRMTAEGGNAFGQIVAQATSNPFGVGGARFHYSDRLEWVDTVYLGAWWKKLFAQIGGFDEEMVRNQDDEFNYRTRKHGGRILLSPKIRSVYTPRGSLRGLWRQYFQYGYWKVRVMQKHPQQMRPRQFAPPLFVMALWVTLVWGLFSWYGRYAFLTLAGSYLVVNTAVSLAGERELPGGSFTRMVVYATLHFSYGTGFVTGLLKFWRYWGRGAE